jgi:hypothetical protein
MNPPPKIGVHTGPGQKDKKKYLRVVARNLGDVYEFIEDLRDAAKNAKESGGTYSAFLTLPGGENVLQVEVTNHVGGSQK